MPIPTAGRRDANHDEIVSALRELGWLVETVKFPTDLLIYRKSEGVYLAEIKIPGQETKLTHAQQRIRDAGWPFCVLTCRQDVFHLSNVSTDPEQGYHA